MELSYITPDGQVTIPRQVMKSLGISCGNEIRIEIENGWLILRKVKITEDGNRNDQVCRVG